VFEDAYGNWAAKADALFQATQSCDREKLALILHSAPHLNDGDTHTIVKHLLSIGHSIWVTGTNNYAALDPHLSVLIDGLDALVN
jgi:hypothetical protein